jgi:nucleotide-binding universal stress UspA family protein
MSEESSRRIVVRTTREGGSPATEAPPHAEPSPSNPRGFSRILCPTDLSPASAGAVGLATEIARAYDAEVVVMHVAQPATEVAAGTTPIRVAATDERAKLSRLVALAHVRGVSAAGITVQGDVVGAILERARSWPADLLVMATHDGRRDLDWALGSVTERVLRQAPCPVLVAGGRLESEGTPPPRRILCPSDFSESAAVALEDAIVLARALLARITLLHVLEWFPGEGDVAHLNIPEYQMDVSQEARERLYQSIPAGDRSLFPEEPIVAVGRPHREIPRVARERSADLIVLGVHRRRALDRTLGGSTICHVVREARCPVLAVPLDTRDARAGTKADCKAAELVAG